MTAAYDTDFAAWADEQAELLRRRASNELDWENLVEEIESLGRSQRHEVYSRLMRICEPLLKLAYQQRIDPPKSWMATITEQRAELERLFEDSPSLRPYAAAQLAKAYASGRKLAAHYTTELPIECPWTIEQVLGPEFWPPPRSD